MQICLHSSRIGLRIEDVKFEPHAGREFGAKLGESVKESEDGGFELAFGAVVTPQAKTLGHPQCQVGPAQARGRRENRRGQGRGRRAFGGAALDSAPNQGNFRVAQLPLVAGVPVKRGRPGRAVRLAGPSGLRLVPAQESCRAPPIWAALFLWPALPAKRLRIEYLSCCATAPSRLQGRLQPQPGGRTRTARGAARKRRRNAPFLPRHRPETFA